MFGKSIAEKAYSELAALKASGDLTKDKWLETVARVVDDTLNEPSLPKISRAELDSLFDAMARACGCNVHELTKPRQGEITRALKDIRRASPGVTPKDIERRAAKFKEKHPTWAQTPSSVAKWWDELGAPKNDIDIYKEPEGNWREVAVRIAGIEYAECTWERVRGVYGRRIWQALS